MRTPSNNARRSRVLTIAGQLPRSIDRNRYHRQTRMRTGRAGAVALLDQLLRQGDELEDATPSSRGLNQDPARM